MIGVSCPCALLVAFGVGDTVFPCLVGGGCCVLIGGGGAVAGAGVEGVHEGVGADVQMGADAGAPDPD